MIMAFARLIHLIVIVCLVFIIYSFFFYISFTCYRPLCSQFIKEKYSPNMTYHCTPSTLYTFRDFWLIYLQNSSAGIAHNTSCLAVQGTSLCIWTVFHQSNTNNHSEKQNRIDNNAFKNKLKCKQLLYRDSDTKEQCLISGFLTVS